MLYYKLKDSQSGMEVDLIDHGGTVTRILAPDRHGSLADVLLGCPTPKDYLRPHPHFNCLIGRYANRISNARFERGLANPSIRVSGLSSSAPTARAVTPAN